ncbi:TatD family hydrolase [Legionella yabuuchiae]|uniref:TatD family hydrolase n=1 Tax=Legionella yabuuchiae TaxID=376727 RepID=UPI001F5FF385|nr:TatD family hydrolase [Legionella yabuuchiae]
MTYNLMNNPNLTLIDSHCHLHTIDLSEFDNKLEHVMQKAHEAGVKEMLCVCIELNDMPELYKLAEKYSNVYISAGLHPNSSVEEEPNVKALSLLASHSSCIAIGETGLDYFRTADDEAIETQRQRFREHIRAACQSQKPLIIHTRDAVEDTIKLMREENAAEIGGVLHCFTESWEMAKKALDLGFYISFSGIVTFKNATDLQEVAKKVPLDRILIETDSPYLAPVPFRGKQNHPALVKHVALAISELRGVNIEQLATQTTDNFYRCFRIGG